MTAGPLLAIVGREWSHGPNGGLWDRLACGHEVPFTGRHDAQTRRCPTCPPGAPAGPLGDAPTLFDTLAEADAEVARYEADRCPCGGSPAWVPPDEARHLASCRNVPLGDA